MAETNNDERSDDWSEDEDLKQAMKYDKVVEKVFDGRYAVWRRARSGDVTIKLKGDFEHFQHDIAQFTNTPRLRLLSTELPSLPHDLIRQFTQIKHLQIGQTRDSSLVEMWRFVEEMKQLEELEVCLKTAICDLPQEICAHLNLLRKLVIRGCGLTSLPHNLGQLTMLEDLDLSSNKLEHLCYSFSSLSNLKYLKLSGNPFVALHNELPFKSFTKIIKLFLISTNLSSLPPLVSHMTEMEVLDIRANSVSHLPKQLCQLHKLRELKAKWNPLVSPPVEVCEGGVSAIHSYFESLLSSLPVKRQRMKVLICGKCQAGKTSLSRTLSAGHCRCTEQSDRTIGMEENRLTLSNERQLIMMDCGGHRSYLLTNQLLVSDRSVNVVVVDASQYQLSEKYFRQHIGHYMQMILERCTLGVILTVFTKADLLSAKQNRVAITDHYVGCVRTMLQLREQQMKMQSQDTQLTRKSSSMFLSHQKVEVREEVLFVSSMTFEGFNELYKRLEEVTSTATLLPTLEAEVPETWQEFEDKLIYSAQVALGIKEKPRNPQFFKNLVVNYSSPIPVWSVKSVTSYGLKFGLGTEEVQSVLPYFHQVSSILYFPLYPSLCCTVFGLVSFVIDVLKVIFHHDHVNSLQYDKRFCQHHIAVSPDNFLKMKSDLIHNACLTIPVLLALWSDFELEAEHLDVLLKLLIQFEFAYILADSKVEQIAMQMMNDETYRQSESHLDSGDTSLYAKGPISYLQSMKAKMLIPWLLADERPMDFCDMWPTDCPSATLQVTAKFSFVYSIPRGIFERLSCLCHQHSSYIRHWRSGFRIDYGCVKVLALMDDSEQEVTMTARCPDAGRNLYHLFHVLWRCINDMEKVLHTLPGVLLNRCITTKKETYFGVGHQKKVFTVFPSGLEYDVDDVSRLQKVLEYPVSDGMDTVISSVSAAVPLQDVFSPDCGLFLTNEEVKAVAHDVSDHWMELAEELDMKTDDIPSKGPGSTQCQRMLKNWHKTCGDSGVVCVLCDALYACRLEHVADKHFGHILDTVLRVQKPAEPTVELETSPTICHAKGSSSQQPKQRATGDESPVTVTMKRDELDMTRHVDNKQIIAISDIARNVWYEIGINLGFEAHELSGYEHKYRDDLNKRLRTVLFDWKLREANPTVGKVIEACEDAKVGPAVRQTLRKLEPVGTSIVVPVTEPQVMPCTVKRSTLISHLLSGSQPHGCLKEVATLMDEGDVMGDDWRRLWAELVKRPLEETIVKEVKAQPGGPTLYTLKLWVRGSGNPSEATIGSLIETLSKVYRNDVAEVLQKYIQVYTGDVSTEHGKDFVMGSNSSLHPDHSVSDENQKTRLEAVSSDRVVATPEGSVVVNGRQDVSSVSSPSKETTCVSALILAIIFILGVLVYQYNNSVEGSIKTSIPAIMFILGVLFSWGIYQYNNSVEGSTKTILISGIMFILVVLFSRGIYQYNNSVEGSTKTSCLSQQPKQLATRDELYKTKHIDDKQILAIAAVARNKWKEIAINLGFETYELSHYEYKFGYGWDKRLRAVLVDWKASEENPTIGKVLEACKEAKVETAVRRALRKLIGDA